MINVKWTLFQLYHGKTKILFDEMMMISVVLDKHTQLDVSSVSSFKQSTSIHEHVALLGNTIMTQNQPVFDINTPQCCESVRMQKNIAKTCSK